MSHDVIERLHFSNCALIWLKVMQSFNSIVFKINFEFNIEGSPIGRDLQGKENLLLN